MSNSQEVSLNEDAVFQEVTESCPDFLYSETEREELEILLRAGPEAFYSSSTNCFLSSEEVTQINSWAQNYHSNLEDNGGECNSQMEDFHSTYFPYHSDLPAPNLDLGWPEKNPWMLRGNATVHTSPPAEGNPPIREIIRRHLQKASQVIAIVTDRLTDNTVIADLHSAASRGVPVYIILNQRSVQENFILSRLRHPNMQVRVLGGKTFCSRTGRIVVGEMKDKFLLVDLETVIHGSYSLTWTDAHLHRQLITVLTGSVVDSFDKEFRILFAASQPVSRRVTDPNVKTSQKLTDFSDLRLQKRPSLDSKIDNPPSLPSDDLLDWDVMGVVPRDDSLLSSPFNQHEEIVLKQMPLQNNTPIMDGVSNNENQFVERRKMCENTSPVTTGVPEKVTPFNNTESTDPATTEMVKRVENRIEKAISRQRFTEKSTNIYYRHLTSLKDKMTEQTHTLPPTQRREHSSRREIILEEQSYTAEANSNVENTPSSRKPIILRLPEKASPSSLSDIMRGMQQSSLGRFRRRPNSTLSERTQSMMDLSTYNPDAHPDERRPVPRFKASFDPDNMTPALALMKKRNDELKAGLYNPPKNFMPRARPRSSSFAFSIDWRRSITEREGDLE